MASTNSPYGLRPINLLGGQAYAGSTRLYAISPSYAVNIQYGDPVIIINTGSTAAALRGNLARFNATTTATTVTSTGGGFGFVGVFVGCTFTDPTYGKVFRQNYTASNAATDIEGYVVDDPDALFQVQADGTLAATTLGCNASLIQTVAGNSGANINSGVSLQASSVATTSTLPVRIVDFVDSTTSQIGDAYTDVIVRINTHFHRTGNTGSAGTAAS
ncbi:hypothetical protein UFOVP1302_22 [uncultured Caudovirales phage]|uniref:Uncharacterized protein n=1 Tax=uncultured Caudovirales phage TaxID=2100421 RepID=A0A6J5PC91_9CAUD|nr:hypothetical protein UFOVP895_25 [uncultured Caudovirales phage]CAB4181746.1 hypothetical protein UFOVP1070_62 [uncultured Caudovirales phage]CAB4195610.1 hypothetical protein UFOVP1302_22 [uncultured Caudovirales phage]CAB4211655.1 hypothetical protein UFOVP1416_10 [uncultured Caudovirales phage]